MSSRTSSAALISHLGAYGKRDDIVKGGDRSSRKANGLESEVLSVTLSKLLNLKFPHLKRRVKTTVSLSHRLIGSWKENAYSKSTWPT